MTIAVAAFLLVLVQSLLKKEVWPFTRYPMFSTYERVEDLKVYRFAFETASGERVWWKPRFYRDVDRLGDLLTESGGKSFLWAAGEVLRLARLEGTDLSAFRFLSVIERRPGRDTLAARISLP